jgi:glycosyltransferase involved in cell wall biosynthesis
MGVTVVVPCFNEAGTIGDLLRAMPPEILGHRVTVVVVDDGSTDRSVQQVSRCRSDLAGSLEIQQIRVPTNRGKGAALQVAMDFVRTEAFDALVWMDSDGQHLPSSLEELVGPVLSGESDLCVGSRYLGRERQKKAPLNRRLVRAAVRSSVEGITGFTISDPFSGLRCFSRTAFGALQLDGNGYEAELESCFSASRAGLKFCEVPIPRIYGSKTSKMGYRHGAFRGRLIVVAGYLRTIKRARVSALVIAPVGAHG